MLLIDRLVEEKIGIAVRQGDFDDLPGQGRPLDLEDDSAIPVELRSAYRLLRNAGYLPAELQLRNEIQQLEHLLNQVEMESEAQAIRRRLCLLRARLAAKGQETNLLLHDSQYRNKLIERIGHHGGHENDG